jgi:hypothetical protein
MRDVSMKTRYAKLLTILLIGGLWSCTSSPAFQKSVSELSSAIKTELSGSELIEGYRQWTRVNPVPAVFHSQIAILCAPATRQLQMEAGNPHRDKFITVYVNDIGKRAMLEEKFPHFPQGSVIVKEKLPSKDSTKPELLTVMMKREAGYNPQNGDWEYMALDGTGKEVHERGRIESCQSCHMMVKDTDYVSRNYLPSELREKLK